MFLPPTLYILPFVLLYMFRLRSQILLIWKFEPSTFQVKYFLCQSCIAISVSCLLKVCTFKVLDPLVKQWYQSLRFVYGI